MSVWMSYKISEHNTVCLTTYNTLLAEINSLISRRSFLLSVPWFWSFAKGKQKFVNHWSCLWYHRSKDIQLNQVDLSIMKSCFSAVIFICGYHFDVVNRCALYFSHLAKSSASSEIDENICLTVFALPLTRREMTSAISYPVFTLS